MNAALEKRREEFLADCPVWTRRTIAGHFDMTAKKYGSRTFISTLEREYTYKEVMERANQLARGLLVMGIHPGDHVALLMGNYPEFIFTKLAIAKIGAVCVLLNAMLQGEELAFELADSDAVALVTADRSGKANHMAVLAKIIPELTKPGSSKHNRFSRFPLLRDVICFSPEGRRYGGTIDLNELCMMGQSVPEAALQQVQDAAAGPDDISDIMYSLGFSDRPKGAMLSHDMMLRGAYASCLCRALEKDCRIYSPLPFYHVFALQQGMMAASFVGGTVIPHVQFSPREALELIEKRRASDILCVPVMLLALLNYDMLKKYNLSSLRAMVCGSIPVPLFLWQRAKEELGLSELITGYGMTEFCGAGTITSPDDPLEVHATSVGRPLFGGVAGMPGLGGYAIEFKVVDPSTGGEAPPGREGEWFCRGSVVTKGYYKRPQENAALIDKDGWLRTGDLGIVHAGGLLQFTGKNKGIYKTSGENVAIKEVEDVFRSHPRVTHAWVGGVPDQIRGEVGVALLDLKKNETASVLEMIDYCKERLARFKVPHHIFFVTGQEMPFVDRDEPDRIKRDRMIEYMAGLLQQKSS